MYYLVLCLCLLATKASWTDEYTSKMLPSTVSVIKGYKFNFTRSPRIQAILLGEHIEWANSSTVSKIQRNLCIAIALEYAKEEAEGEAAREDADLDYLVDVKKFLRHVETEIDRYRELSEGISNRDVRGLRLNP